MNKITAVITAFNRADFVATCIGALREAQHADLQIKVLLMDNGSSDKTAEAAAAAGDLVSVFRTEDNRPIAEVINRGLLMAYADLETNYILLMNEDTLFRPGSVQELVDASDAHPLSLSTPLQINYRKPEHLDDNAYKDVLRTREIIEDAILGRPLKQAYPLHTIIAAAMFGRREVWASVGEWDENFWFYGVDDDFCNRARWLGYEILLVPNSHLLHAHGKLGAGENKPTWQPYPKWCKETQSRYLFLLKDPNYSLPVAYLHALWHATETFFGCLKKTWPKGMFGAIDIYFHCLLRWRQIRDARTRHYDMARRISL